MNWVRHSPYSSTSVRDFRRKKGARGGGFLSFEIACGNVGNSRGSHRRVGLRIYSPTTSMVNRRLSDPARAGNPTHAQMLSFEDSAIRVAACFWRSGQQGE